MIAQAHLLIVSQIFTGQPEPLHPNWKFIRSVSGDNEGQCGPSILNGAQTPVAKT